MYWDFVARHRPRLEQNPRMRALVRSLDRFSPEEREGIHAAAETHRAALRPLDPPWTIDEDAG